MHVFIFVNCRFLIFQSMLAGLCWYYIPGSTQHSVEAMSGKMFLTENGKTFLFRPRPIKNFVNLSSNKDQNGISSILKKMQTKKLFFLQLTAEIKPTKPTNLNRTKVNSQNQDQAIVDWNITKSLGVECHQKLWKGWRAFPKIVLRLFPQFPHATTRLFLHVELLLLSWKPGKMKTISELFCYVILKQNQNHTRVIGPKSYEADFF